MRARSLHTAAVGAAIAMLAVVAPAARAGAAPSAACTATSGVTVVVDFTRFSRSIERGCAAGAPTDALTAIHAAGFVTAGTSRYGDAFLCRIDDLPAPKDEACSDTPPASSSWSFYFAKPGDASWTYSRTGVLSYHPAPGTAMAFAFGDSAKPGIRPADAIPTPPATTPTSTTAPPVSALIVTTTPPAPPVTAAVRPAAVTTTTASQSATRPVITARSAPTTTTAARVVDRTASAKIPHDDSGSPLPALVGAALAVALGASAVVTIRGRRRRTA
jgi:hypothetical protein